MVEFEKRASHPNTNACGEFFGFAALGTKDAFISYSACREWRNGTKMGGHEQTFETDLVRCRHGGFPMLNLEAATLKQLRQRIEELRVEAARLRRLLAENKKECVAINEMIKSEGGKVDPHACEA